MDTKYIAVGKNVFVKEIVEERVVNGWTITDSLDSDFAFGEIVLVSESYVENGVSIQTPFEKGEKIVFPKISGVRVQFNGEMLVKVSINDIVAKETTV